jgi:hypothetical protein
MLRKLPLSKGQLFELGLLAEELLKGVEERGDEEGWRGRMGQELVDADGP